MTGNCQDLGLRYREVCSHSKPYSDTLTKGGQRKGQKWGRHSYKKKNNWKNKSTNRMGFLVSLSSDTVLISGNSGVHIHELDAFLEAFGSLTSLRKCFRALVLDNNIPDLVFAIQYRNPENKRSIAATT